MPYLASTYIVAIHIDGGHDRLRLEYHILALANARVYFLQEVGRTIARTCPKEILQMHLILYFLIVIIQIII